MKEKHIDRTFFQFYFNYHLFQNSVLKDQMLSLSESIDMPLKALFFNPNSPIQTITMHGTHRKKQTRTKKILKYGKRRERSDNIVVFFLFFLFFFFLFLYYVTSLLNYFRIRVHPDCLSLSIESPRRQYNRLYTGCWRWWRVLGFGAKLKQKKKTKN